MAAAHDVSNLGEGAIEKEKFLLSLHSKSVICWKWDKCPNIIYLMVHIENLSIVGAGHRRKTARDELAK